MFSYFIRQYRVTAIIIVVILFIFAAIIAFISVSRIGKQPVTVYLVPNDATLTVNGQQIGQGTTYLKPGMYNVKASKAGFASYSGSLTVGNPNTATVDIALEGVSADAISWEKDHQDLYLAREGRAGIQANQQGEDFTARNPIISNLPFHNAYYDIGYELNPTDPSGNSIIITIDAASGFRNAAIQQIQTFGYDPTNFKIEFSNYTNPFKS